MNINDAFPSPFISAVDLPDDGMPVTFQAVSMEVFEGEKNPKAICHFREFDKGMLLNKTNKNSIVEVMGSPETNAWIGRRITIYPTECDYKGDRVACIRVKLRAPEKNVTGDPGINAMLKAFGELDVTRQMIEARFGPIVELSAYNRDRLREIHDAMVGQGVQWAAFNANDARGGELVVQRAW